MMNIKLKINGAGAGENGFELGSFKKAMLEQAAIKVVACLHIMIKVSGKYLRTSGAPKSQDCVSSSRFPPGGK